jgi:hypothetical protein
MPESTLTHARVDYIPQSGTLDLASEFIDISHTDSREIREVAIIEFSLMLK